MFVARSCQGQGFGGMLLAHCFDAARERGYRELVLETHTAFVEARRYYERHGWTLWPHASGRDSTTRMYSMRLSDPRSMVSASR